MGTIDSGKVFHNTHETVWSIEDAYEAGINTSACGTAHMQ